MTLIGKVLAGRYEILEEVGNGGMAVVYKARCQLLNRFVAVKVLRPDLQNDQEFVRRFNVEAQAAASLAHPNIVSIYDVGYEDGLHYIVMEFIEGKTLKEYIEERKILPWREAVDFAIQVAKGLEQAHRNSIIHRDIKPHNIIMTADGVLKVTDFGIARANVQSTVTCEDSAIGSVHYISPEQARGGYTDERSDIYSLAVVLYEMLTGRVPFDSDRPVTVAIMHLQDNPVKPREYNISIPLALENIVMKAMSKEMSARHKSASELIAELQDVLVNTNPAKEYFSVPDNDSLDASADKAATIKIPSVKAASAAGMRSNSGSAVGVRQTDTTGTQSFSAVQKRNAGVNLREITQDSDSANNLSARNGTVDNRAGYDRQSMDETVKMPVVGSDYATGGAAYDMDETENENLKQSKKKKDSYTVDKKTSRKVIIAAVLSAVVIVGGFVYGILNFLGLLGNSDSDVPSVPDVVDMIYEDAVEQYENIDSDSEYQLDFVIKERVSSSKPANTILEQTPESGTKLKKDDMTKVELTVSAGDGKIVLDDYYKWEKDEAKAAIRNLGLECEFAEVYNDEVEKGKVVSQNPAKDSAVTKGTTVILSISLGSDSENQGNEVENYIGKTDLDAVKEAIEKQGFKAVFVNEPHKTAKKGEIFNQVPAAGEQLEKGEKITLYVSTGSDSGSSGTGVITDKPPMPGQDTSGTSNSDGGGSSEQRKKVKWLTIYGPKDKESSFVEVKMDGSVIFSKTLQKNGSTLLKLESDKSQVEIEILYDGVSSQKSTVELH